MSYNHLIENIQPFKISIIGMPCINMYAFDDQKFILSCTELDCCFCKTSFCSFDQDVNNTLVPRLVVPSKKFQKIMALRTRTLALVESKTVFSQASSRSLYKPTLCFLYELYKVLTEVAGEGGTDCPPQKFLSSQKFRHLMG